MFKNKTIYAFHWLKYLLTYSQQWIAVWGALQQRVYQGRKIDTVEELKRAIITEWQKLSQRFIDSSINEWHRRLECVVRNDGGHIEHCSLA